MDTWSVAAWFETQTRQACALRGIKDMDDIEVIRSVQAGDSESFSLLVQKYHQHLLNFVYRLVGR
jgi:hypothetical protein